METRKALAVAMIIIGVMLASSLAVGAVDDEWDRHRYWSVDHSDVEYSGPLDRSGGGYSGPLDGQDTGD